MLSITLDDRVDFVGNTIVARIEQHAMARELCRQGLARLVGREGHGRAIAHQSNALLGNPGRVQPAQLILTQHFEAIDAPAPEIREGKEHVEHPRPPRTSRDQAFGIEIGDAIDQPTPPERLERRQ